jgi:hypothetical protein
MAACSSWLCEVLLLFRSLTTPLEKTDFQEQQLQPAIWGSCFAHLRCNGLAAWHLLLHQLQAQRHTSWGQYASAAMSRVQCRAMRHAYSVLLHPESLLQQALLRYFANLPTTDSCCHSAATP